MSHTVLKKDDPIVYCVRNLVSSLLRLLYLKQDLRQ